MVSACLGINHVLNLDTCSIHAEFFRLLGQLKRICCLNALLRTALINASVAQVPRALIPPNFCRQGGRIIKPP